MPKKQTIDLSNIKDKTVMEWCKHQSTLIRLPLDFVIEGKIKDIKSEIEILSGLIRLKQKDLKTLMDGK